MTTDIPNLSEPDSLSEQAFSTEAGKAAVWEQVNRLVNYPSFARSKRYPDLLRYIVAKTLDGESESLKERVLGIEVFHRLPDYDSTRDSIVRVTAAELRKRLFHYYGDPTHQDELRISLPAGAYVPEFMAPTGWPEVGLQQSVSGPTNPVQSSSSSGQIPLPQAAPPTASLASRPKWVWGVVAGVMLVLIAVTVASVLVLRPKKESALDMFWAPAFRSSGPILICFNDHPLDTSQLLDAENPVFPTHPASQAQVMSASTVPLIAEISRYFSEHGRASKIQGQSKTTFDDIKGGPIVLFGAFNNYWTLKMTQPLRFHFANSPDLTKFWIEDRQAPTSREWFTDANVKVRKDYALLARFVPPSTGQTTFVIAGLRPPSMTEGVKLLFSPELLGKAAESAAAKPDANLELVIETDVVDGVAGKPTVVAMHAW